MCGVPPARPPNAGRPPAQRHRRLHVTIGLWISVGLIFLSITGLTWSRRAGDHIDGARGYLGWVTPSVTRELGTGSAIASESLGHEDHAGHGVVAASAGPVDHVRALDRILEASRAAGIDAKGLEIRTPKADEAWLVREVDRSWPTQVDTIAIDPRSMSVTSRADFATFPVIAKLIRWGVDAHMGILFGLPNQLILAALGLSLVATMLYGYAIWWRKRPVPGSAARTLTESWRRLPGVQQVMVLAVAVGLGWALPLMGASLAAFVLVDLVRWRWSVGRLGRPRLS